MTATAEYLETAVVSYPDRARALTIDSADRYTAAGEYLTEIKALRHEIADTFDPIIRKAHAAHREACDRKRQVEAPLVEAEGLLKTSMARYVEAERRREAEERRRLEEAARKAEEEARLAEAAALEEAGQAELAEQVLELPSVAPPPVVAPAAPKVAGVTTRETWDAEVTDKLALVRAIAAGQVPLAAVDVNQGVLRQQARSLGAELRWPGVRAFKQTTIAAGRAR